MTKTTASRKSMRPVRKNEAQGKSTTRKATAPKVTTVAEATAAYGDILTATDGLQAAAETYAQFSDTVARWAAWSLTYKGTARKFSQEVTATPEHPDGDDTRKNLLGRLQATARLLASSKSGKGTRALTTAEAVKVANVKGVAAVKAITDAMDAGGDPLNTRSHAAVKPSSKGQGGTSRTSALKVTPDTLVTILDMMVKVAPHVSKGDTAVEAARRATTLAEILTARAATLAMPVKGTRSAPARKTA